ncbi:unnamed protein product [Calypogeia fissa]
MIKDSVLNSWYNLQQILRGPRATSSSASSLNFAGEPPKQINDYVYEVFNPPGRPSIELVFFHGLQLEGSKEAHLTTWLTPDGSELWPKWILDYYPEARILLISYDAFTRRTREQGNMDMFLTCENLVQDLTMGDAQVGQAGCPVALVGHCIGGLVMKELCIALDSTVGKLQFYKPDNLAQNLYLNINGLFFYGCPHHGSKFADGSNEEGELLKEATTLNKVAERRNEVFRKLRAEREWNTCGIGEALETKLGKFKGLIVPEASARADVDVYYTDGDADHFDVSRTKSKQSSSFGVLRDFIGGILEKDKKRHIPEDETSTKLVGLKGQLNTIIKKLDGVQRLAIVGMPGIGKSTLAKRLYYTPGRSYDFTCYLSDVKKFMGDRDDPGYLKGEIIKNLYYKGKKVHESCRWESLIGKKVLLVLDDVDCASQVPQTIISGLMDGSHVIVTSREDGFLLQEDFKCHRVKQLEPEVSKGLFCHHCFGSEVAPDLYKDHVSQIMEVLQGLPLGLVVVGGFLKHKGSLGLWDDVLKRLKLAMSLDGKKYDRLWSVMELVFEKLQEEERQMFLDIATCFHGEDMEEVKQAWRYCGWATTAVLGLTNLTEKNLITIENTPYSISPRYVIRMHEVLRKLGQSKARLEHDDVTTHSRVRYDRTNPLPTTWPFSEDNRKVKVLMISCWTFNSWTIDIQQLHGLKELRVLWLDGVSLKGPCTFLPQNLAYLRIRKSSWIDKMDLSSLFKPLRGKLVQLGKLKCMEIVECHKLEGLLNWMGSLQGLEDLRLVSCFCLKAPPNTVRQLRAIQHLEIMCQDCVALVDILGELQSLKNLVVRECYVHGSPKDSEQILFLESLARIGFLQSSRQIDLPPVKYREFHILFSDSESISEIDVSLCAETSWFNDRTATFMFVKDYSRLKSLADILERRLGFRITRLMIKDCSRLEDALQPFQGLKHLDIEGCHNLQALPNARGGLKVLKTLSIKSCGKSKFLSLLELPDLLELTIQSCKKLEFLSLVELPNLLKLTVQSCEKLEHLGGLPELPILGCLTIGDCRNLQALPPLETLGVLRKLRIYSCESLFCIPIGPATLDMLEELTIGDCKQMRALPPLEQLQALQRLTIYSFDSLKSIPSCLGQLHRLQYLAIWDCKNLEGLPPLNQLRALRWLRIYSCKSLKFVPAGIAEVHQLQYLAIGDCNRDCNNMEDLSTGFLELLCPKAPAFAEFAIHSWGSWVSLPTHDVGYSRGQEYGVTIEGQPPPRQLTIYSRASWISLPFEFGDFRRGLGCLTIRDCYNLVKLPDTLGDLQGLRELTICSCHNLRVLPDSLWQLQGLDCLTVRDCHRLKALPDALGELQALRELTIDSCTSLRELPVGFGSLQGLECLTIRSCGSLKTIPESLLELRTLRVLNIESCENFRRPRIPAPRARLSNHAGSELLRGYSRRPRKPLWLTIIENLCQ